jgi:hypothetical protein
MTPNLGMQATAATKEVELTKPDRVAVLLTFAKDRQGWLDCPFDAKKR